MDQQPKIPTLKDAQKPQVKIKGLGAGLTLFDRLKQFKKKDLAFILAGLGTLFMAPLAEHFMMAPENGDATLGQGWGGTGGRGSFFGNGGSPYENGNNNIAQGGAIGGAGDIITPLNVRDPSALVMGPGAAQQPPAGSAAPATPPPAAPARNENDYKDALAGAASRAASAAVKKAPLPVPKVALGGSGLRGLGVAGGGSSASGGLGPINSGNLGQAGTGGGGLNLVRSTPGFRGAAGPRGPNSPQGLDGTKKAGQNAGDAFSRSGSALSGLNAAAAEQIPTGGSGFAGNGQGGAGANDKGPGGSGPGGSKSVGESLAFIAAKERMMENLKLEFEKKKLMDNTLLLYGIRNDVVKASASEIGKGLTKMFMCSVLNMGCPAPEDEYTCMGIPAKGSDIPRCDEGGGEGKDKARTTACYWPQADGTLTTGKDGTGAVCRPTGKGGGATPNPKAENPPGGGFDRLGPGGSAAVAKLNEVCTQVDTVLKGTPDPARDAFLNSVRDKATQLVVVRDAILGQSADCATKKPTLRGTLDGSGKDLAASQAAAFDAVPKLNDALFKDVNADKVGNYTEALNTASDSPVLLAKEANGILTKIVTYASGNGLDKPLGLTVSDGAANMPTQAETQANRAKLEALKKTLDDSQTNLAAYLEKAKAAQLRLDGQQVGQAAAAPAAADAKQPILSDLEQIAAKPGSLLKVQEANVDYATKKEAIEKATKPAEKATEIAHTAEAIVNSATDAKTKIGAVDAVAPPESETEKYKAYQEKATAARTAIESVRGAQAAWIVEVTNAAVEAKATLGGPPKP